MLQLRKLLWSTAIRKLRVFCKHSTLHGFYYLSEDRHSMVYGVWITIIMASLSLCAFLSNMIWLKYTMDPTFTVVQTTHFSTIEIPFPAITVCDSEQIYGPNTNNVTNILKQRSYNDKQIEEFYKSFTGVKANDYEPSDYVKKMHRLLHDLGYTYYIMLDMFSKPCDVLLVQCTWRSQLHNCTDMFRNVYTVFGFCCQFDMQFFRNNADPNTDFLPGVEVADALDIIVNVEKLKFTGEETTGYALLYVYDDHSHITVIDSPTTLTPGGYFDTNIYVWAIESSNDVRSLSVDERKCYLREELSYMKSFYQECMSVNILRKVVSYCRCLPFGYSATTLQANEDFPKCTWDRLACVYKYLEKVKNNIKDIVHENNCLQSCDFVHYITEIEYIQYQRNVQSFNKIKSKRENNFSNVIVHYAGRTCIKYRREVLYSWDQMLANLGGIFGLCLGGSIISVIEVVWFAIEFTFTLFKGMKNTKTNPKEKTAFTLTKKDSLFNVQKGKGNVFVREGKLKFVN